MCNDCNTTENQISITHDVDIPIACNPSAMGNDWEHHKGVVRDWYGAIEETVELESGFAYRFTATTERLMNLAEFVSRERLCCPFYTFQIEVTPQGKVWLRLTGPEGTKELMESMKDELAG